MFKIVRISFRRYENSKCARMHDHLQIRNSPFLLIHKDLTNVMCLNEIDGT